jgi:signal transduction histidine kinase
VHETYAESGDLTPSFQPVHTRPFLERMKTLYSRHPVALAKRVTLHDPWDGMITTDQRLLGRVLGNMIKNALEATELDGTVTIRCVDLGTHVAFRVHNAAEMPEHVQMQVFQRSFSTKADSGRGIGTHSMKLFGERYLKGKVTFTSREPDGTTFSLTLPKILSDMSPGAG